MKVIATKAGFDGKSLRQAGDVFDMPEGSKASWFVKADKKPEGKAPADKKPDDLV